MTLPSRPLPPETQHNRNPFTFVQEGAGLEAEVLASFLVLVPEATQFHEVLTKIFRKKIKRAKVVCITPPPQWLVLYSQRQA